MDPEKHLPSPSLDDDFESESLLPHTLLKYRLGADFEKKRMRYLLLTVFGVAVYTLAIMGLTVTTLRKVDYECRGGPHLYPNLLEDAIEYKLQTFEDNHKPDHPFFGEPSKELDHNWFELTKCELRKKMEKKEAVIISKLSNIAKRVRCEDSRVGSRASWARIPGCSLHRRRVLWDADGSPQPALPGM